MANLVVVVAAGSFLQRSFFDARHPGRQEIEDLLYCLVVARTIGIELCVPINGGALRLIIGFHPELSLAVL